jgi:hypothetical protein
MQPYFMPYIGYFQLMNHVDKWVIFDRVQFIDKGWVNRNRILHPDQSKQWQFITVPLSKRGQFSNICDISIHNQQKWQMQVKGKLEYLRKKAPYFRVTMDWLDECLSSDTTSLSEMLSHSLITTAQYLGIDTPIVTQSSENIAIDEAEHAGQWALNIAKFYGANEYVNPCGGVSIFRQSEFDESNIKLSFLETELKPYTQQRDFVAGLSIIDVLLWNSVSDVKKALQEDFRIRSHQELLDSGK